MDRDAALERFTEFAEGLEQDGLKIHAASARPDSLLDGEPVTRVLLLADDPRGETWELATTIELNKRLQRRAAELDLPWLDISMVPLSEAASVDAFAS